MITAIILIVWIVSVIGAFMLSDHYSHPAPFFMWIVCAVFWIIPIFTGVPVPSGHGEYTGYITAVEQNGAIFKGWNIYLKTDLQSSNEDKACIDRNNPELIKELQELQKEKKNITLSYESEWQFAIGVCPQTNWKITNIIK